MIHGTNEELDCLVETLVRFATGPLKVRQLVRVMEDIGREDVTTFDIRSSTWRLVNAKRLRFEENYTITAPEREKRKNDGEDN